MGDEDEQMDVNEVEETEHEYLHAVTAFNNLDQSQDSMHGCLTVPTFTLGQSNQLQASQGFAFLGVNQGQNITAEESASSNVLLTDAQALHNLYAQQGNVVLANQAIAASLGATMQGFGKNFVVTNIANSDSFSKANMNALLLQDSHFNPVNTGLTNTPQDILAAAGHQVDGDKGAGNQADSGEGASSDEKSGKIKGSPRCKGKKIRCSSSTESEEMIPEIKQEASPLIYPKSECLDASATESSFRPTLEEILTEKKLALMRSPDVIKFLQAQQQNRHIKD